MLVVCAGLWGRTLVTTMYVRVQGLRMCRTLGQDSGYDYVCTSTRAMYVQDSGAAEAREEAAQATCADSYATGMTMMHLQPRVGVAGGMPGEEQGSFVSCSIYFTPS